MRRLRIARVFVASVSLALIGWSAPAAMATSGEHCVAHLDSSSDKITDYQCFDTFAAAISHATLGNVDLPASARTVSDAQLAEAGASSDSAALPAVTLGTEYDGTNFGAPTLTLTASTGCSGSEVHRYPNLSAYGWNNRPSSAKAYGGCYSDHYDDTYYGDPMYRCTGHCTGLGSLNNRTSSIKVW